MRHRIAHRGYSAVAPENTLPAFAAAVRAGATQVEFDVRTTVDGVPVVIHDRTLDRTTTGTGYVWDQPAATVLSLDAGAWFSPAHEGVRVPSLAATLDLLAPSGAEILLELKSPADAEQVKRIVELIADHALTDRTIIQAFNPDVVALVRDAAPHLRRGLLREGVADNTVPLAVELGVTCCNPSVDDVLASPSTVDELIAHGIEVTPWTANDMTQWPTLAATGVTGLITDRVGELTGWSKSPATN
jgi:glycerophosphoryl diester phosphodiesterase